MNIPPEILETKRRHVDRAMEAERALQAGLITDDEWESIADLAIAWCKFVEAHENPGYDIVFPTCAACHLKFGLPRWQLETNMEEEDWKPVCLLCSGIEDTHGPSNP